MSILRWLKQICCSHFGSIEFERNISYAESEFSGGKLSLWHCTRCDALIARDHTYLGPDPPRS